MSEQESDSAEGKGAPVGIGPDFAKNYGQRTTLYEAAKLGFGKDFCNDCLVSIHGGPYPELGCCCSCHTSPEPQSHPPVKQ